MSSKQVFTAFLQSGQNVRQGIRHLSKSLLISQKEIPRGSCPYSEAFCLLMTAKKMTMTDGIITQPASALRHSHLLWNAKQGRNGTPSLFVFFSLFLLLDVVLWMNRVTTTLWSPQLLRRLPWTLVNKLLLCNRWTEVSFPVPIVEPCLLQRRGGKPDDTPY